LDAEFECRFRNAGLEVIGRFEENGALSVTEAFHGVVHIDAEPVERIQRRAAGAARRVNELWKARARSSGVLSEDGTVLVAAGMDYGWVCVRLTDVADISALAAPSGELLFIARSMRGHRVCAASTEEGEYWIVEEDFPN
jgi:hypothetical protein